MANHRCFAKSVVDTDKFLDMEHSAQTLYFHLGMNADDDGFVSSPRKIARSVGCVNEDINRLIKKGFLISFESGVVVVAHWNLNNSIRKDRHTPTDYTRELSLLEIKDGVYFLKRQPNDNQLTTKRQPNDNQMSGGCPVQDKISKDKIIQENIKQENTSKDKESKENACARENSLESSGFFELPLNDGSTYVVSSEEVEYYKSIYPHVNVDKELRSMAVMWADEPKSKWEIKACISEWLEAREVQLTS